MLRRYLSCKYKIFNEINEEKLKLKRIELKTNDKLRIERGNIHEKEYFKELKKRKFYTKPSVAKRLKREAAEKQRHKDLKRELRAAMKADF